MGANASALSHSGSCPEPCPAGKPCKDSAAATLHAVHAADSASSISGSHVAAEQAHQQPSGAGRSLLATLKDRFQSSWVTAGLAPCAELQAAVMSAHAEVTAGAKLKFGELYRMGHMLGTGHYARVHEATSLQDGATYAVKVLPKATKKHKAREQLQKVVKEVAVMRLLGDHPTAVQLHQVLHDKQNYYLIMEHCSGGELFDHVYKVDKLPEAEAAYYMRQLASFLAHAHTLCIAHRDIKPENMLLAPVRPGDKGTCPTGWRLKVIDYGCSAFCLPGHHLHDAVGTVCYVAPEVLMHNYDVQSDLWSAGVVLYMLLCGYLPFDGRNNEETLLLVRAGDFDMLPEDWDDVSTAAQDLVKALLSYKPAGRPTAAQLLQHSWIQQDARAAGPAAAAAGPATSTALPDNAAPGAVSVTSTAGSSAGPC